MRFAFFGDVVGRSGREGLAEHLPGLRRALELEFVIINAENAAAGFGITEATARELARLGAKVAVLDLNMDNAERVAKDIGGMAVKCNVSDPDSMAQAIETAAAAHGPARILMQIAGIGSAKRVVGKDGNAAPLEDFAKVINVNLIGTYNA
eukprot:gene38456-61960_t